MCKLRLTYVLFMNDNILKGQEKIEPASSQDEVAKTPEELERERDFREIIAKRMAAKRKGLHEEGEDSDSAVGTIQLKISSHVEKLLAESVDDQIKIIDAYVALFHEYEEQYPFQGDLQISSDLRKYVEHIMKADTRVALGSVFRRMTSESSPLLRGEGKLAGPSAHFKEATYDLARLFIKMCKGRGAQSGRARVTTLLRYAHEPHYEQGIETATELCSGVSAEYETENGIEHWMPTLGKGDLVFDVGCGPGRTLDVFEQQVGEGNAVGIDLNLLFASKDPRIQLGMIDVSQEKISEEDAVHAEYLSFQRCFGSAKLVLASLVIDRVANQYQFIQNCAALLQPNGHLVIGLLLPVKGEDDEPDLGTKLQYVIDPITAGEDMEVDYALVRMQLRRTGFAKVMRRHFPIKDPVTGREYNNHYLIVAERGTE